MKYKLSLFIGITSVAFILIGARIALPYVLIHYAQNRINQIPEYQATIEDLDVHLFRGSYTIKGVALNRVNKNIPIPFFSAEKIDLSIQWRALLNGALVAKIEAFKPHLNFVIEPNHKNQQLTIDKEWEYAVKALFPLNFNKVILKEGKIALHSFRGKPPFELNLDNIDFQLDNLQKVTDSSRLYSTFAGKGRMNKGQFLIEGRVDPFASHPSFVLKSSLNKMQIKGANDFLLHFTKIDVQQGEFSLYSEIAADHGKIRGYAKPLIKNLHILDPQKEVNPIEFLYQGIVEVGAKILTNQKKHTIATKVNFKGTIQDPKTSTLSIIGYLLRNAFIQALLPQIDNTIEMKDVTLNAKNVG